jgi:hypothetical protein
VRDVYAALLNLEGEADRSFLVAVSQLLSWATARYSVAPSDLRGGDSRPEQDVEIAWQTLVHPSEPAALWSLAWRHPHDVDQSLRWTVWADVGYDKSMAWVSLRVAIEPVALEVRPLRFDVFRPKVIASLLEAPGVKADGRHLALSSMSISGTEMTDLVALLLDPHRALPVVVITKPSGEDHLLLDADRVADQLAGLTHTFVLADGATAYALTDAVGKELSVFLGAARLYWPGLTKTADKFAHPLWLPDVIREREARGRGVADEIARTVIQIATFRVPLPGLRRAIQRALEEKRSGELVDLRQRAEHAGLDDEWLGELERALDAEGEANRVKATLEHENADLRDRLGSAEENVAALSVELGRALGTPQATLESPDESQPRSVEEAVRIAAAQSGHLVFLTEAFSSAADSPYQQPDRVLDALLRLGQIATRYAADDLPRGFRVAFDEAGLQFAVDISDTAKAKYGRHYERVVDGQLVMLGPHVKLGIGPPDSHVRVYFWVDEAGRRFYVGHVGKHLPDDST